MQAPHPPSPQPSLVPVSPRERSQLRSVCSGVKSFSGASLYSLPFTQKYRREPPLPGATAVADETPAPSGAPAGGAIRFKSVCAEMTLQRSLFLHWSLPVRPRAAHGGARSLGLGPRLFSSCSSTWRSRGFCEKNASVRRREAGGVRITTKSLGITVIMQGYRYVVCLMSKQSLLGTG